MSIHSPQNPSLRNRVGYLTQSIINLVLPPVCASCGQVGSLLCEECLANITWIKQPICHHCGKPQSISVAECRNCRIRPLPLRFIRAAAIYSGPVAKVLQQMKYEGYFGLAGELAGLMYKAWPDWKHPVDQVIPIPLHPDRQRKRGYNQSQLLVDLLGQMLGWRTEYETLVRVKRTDPQVGLTIEQRSENLRDAFSVEGDIIKNQRIMLVDDVCTTGATLAAAADVLISNGARSVTAYCLATAASNQDITIA